MEGISNVSVLLKHSSADPPLSMVSFSHATPGVLTDASHTFQDQQATESLLKVIEKFSKIVERRPQNCFTLGEHNRFVQLAHSKGSLEGGVVGWTEGKGREEGVSYWKRMRWSCEESGEMGQVKSNLDGPPITVLSNSLDSAIIFPSLTEEVSGPTVDPSPTGAGTCYQCSLCPYHSQTLSQLKEHLKQHDEVHTDFLLMCSQCHFTSQDQGLLESHVQQHLGQDYDLGLEKPRWDTAEDSTQLAKEEIKKWYSYEEYGIYRCLICSYVCSQQRMLKTHAWKHAGLVDCSYPIFEDEEDRAMRKVVPASSCALGTTGKVVVVSSLSLSEKRLDKASTTCKHQLVATPSGGDEKSDSTKKRVSHIVKERQKLVAVQNNHEGCLFPVKHINSDEPLLEVNVKTEEDYDLLSSAQKIIHRGPKSADHINVIVERLPSAEDSLLTTNPLLLLDQDEELLLTEEGEEHKQQCSLKKEEGFTVESLRSPHVPANQELAGDENIPPLVVGRKRTHSESLHLHSLAAEALVAMPMRTLEVTHSYCQGTPTLAAGAPQDAEALPMEEFQGGEEEDGPAFKSGISLSLLTVIERLQERSDQNASDEDILKELRNNAQVQSTGVGAVEPSTMSGNRSGDSVHSIPGVDALLTSSSSFVDYLPGCERPYRCRLCHYSSDNKGYVKQHLRVHRQRKPYQCPICEHVASDSKDLESHMIHHCKLKSYQCKHCPHAFHYKVRGWVTFNTHFPFFNF